MKIYEAQTNSSNKYIRTVNGKLKLSDLKGGMTLPYEHIIQNICDYLIKKK